MKTPSYEPRPTVGIASTAWLVARHTPLMSNRKAMLPSLLVAVAPMVIAAIIALHGSAPPGKDVFLGLVHGYFVQFAVGVLMLGIGLSGFPVDEAQGTVSYLFTKPISRLGILLGRFLSAAAVGGLLTVLSCSASGLMVGAPLALIVKTWPALVAASVYYGVLFTVLPLVTTKAAAVGLVYVLVWESVMSVIPGAIHTLTATYYVRALLPRAALLDVTPVAFLSFLSSPPSTFNAIARLTVTCAVVAIAGAALLNKREYSASRSADEGA
ncbi:hypothetical protein JXA88_13205 [Candidatus Fermentibacteria bacterium]|nr:hypothetical protein [Candidatus Fermentibacteria bacterium]